MKKISVIIPCRNEAGFIGKCLDSVLQTDYPDACLEIIICDGMSDDGTREILDDYKRRYSSIRVLNNEKRTTQFALNLGIHSSQNEMVMILGAHSELSKNFFSVCMNIMETRSDVMCVGGLLENVFENKNSEIISKAMSSPFGVGSAHFRTGFKEGEVDTVAFGVYRRSVFDQVGFFDEALARNQDDEFNFRLTKNKMKIFLTSKTVVKYYVRSSYGKLIRQYFQYGYWKIYVNRNHKTITTFRQIIPFLFVLFLAGGIIIPFLPNYYSFVWCGFLLLYILGAITFAFKESSSLLTVIRIVYAFFILHIAYGWGYLRGIVDFLIMQKKPHIKRQELTR